MGRSGRRIAPLLCAFPVAGLSLLASVAPLPADEVHMLVADFLGGADVSGRTVTLPPPRFPTAAEALAASAGP